MFDDKNGRDKQAHDTEKRQRERDTAIELERADEAEPPVESAELTALEQDLDSLAFPATGADIVTAVGDRQIDTADGTHRIAALVPDTTAEELGSRAAVRIRVQRPTIAAATKRIVEASEAAGTAPLRGSQREAYEKTLRALKRVDPDDADCIREITDWIVGRIDETGALPGSRSVRRQAASYRRSNGYESLSDEWLGV